MEEMGFLLKKKLNALAHNFCDMRGYRPAGACDFAESEHPVGIMCWNQAVIAYATLMNDKEVLKYKNKFVP